MKNEQIFLAMIISALIQWVLHWGLAHIVRKQFHPVLNYILGVLAIFIPLAVLFNGWGSWAELLAMAWVIGGAGLAVICAYLADHAAEWIHTAAGERQARLEAEEREQVVMSGLRKAAGFEHAQE